MIRKRVNIITKAAVLYLDCGNLVLFLPNGRQIKACNIVDLPIASQPLLLIINPTQFLQVQQRLSHLYLTSWQQQILQELLSSTFILRAILFLPHLIGSSEIQIATELINFSKQKYLKISQTGILFWNQLKAENLALQLQETGLYLRRYQIEFKKAPENLTLINTRLEEVIEQGLQKATFALQSDDFPLIKKLIQKQRSSRLYVCITVGLMHLIAGFAVIGILCLWWGTKIFFQHNPWQLTEEVKPLSAAACNKLKQFKEFVNFNKRSPSFSIKLLKSLFQQFSGKITATDMVWQSGEWTVSFIINPTFISETMKIKEWIKENLPNSKITEAQSGIHQYNLQFN